MPRRKKHPEPEQLQAASASDTISDLDMTDFARPKAAEGLRSRPIAPRPRQGEPAASFAGLDIRITSDGRNWRIKSKRELTGVEKDRLAESGFQADNEEERNWTGSQAELLRRGTDINLVGMALGKPDLYAGRGR